MGGYSSTFSSLFKKAASVDVEFSATLEEKSPIRSDAVIGGVQSRGRLSGRTGASATNDGRGFGAG